MRPGILRISGYRFGMASLLVVALLSAGSTFAAGDKKDGKDQGKRLQQRVRALEQEKNQLLQSKSQLDGQLKEATDQIKHARQGAEAANRKRALLDKALIAAEAEKAELAARLAATEQHAVETEATLARTEKTLAETTTTLLGTQDAKRQLEAALAARTQEVSGCTAKNESLHRTGVALLKAYQDKSCLSTVMQREPLTLLKRVDVENAVDEYREKLDQDLVNQQREERRKLARLKADALKAEQEKAEAEKAEQLRAEQEKAQRVKVRQQNDLDKMTRKIKDFFGNLEWEW